MSSERGGIFSKLVWLIAFILAFIGGKTAVEHIFFGKQDIDKVLIKAAEDLNEKAPIMVDSGTRLDSVTGINRSFRYNYTLVGFASNEIDSAQLNRTLKNQLTDSVCNSNEMRIFIDNNVPVTYAYYGKDGNQITIITIESYHCKK